MLFSLMNSIINVKFKIYSYACRDMRSMVHDESTHHHNFRTTTHGRDDDRGVVVWCVCLLFSVLLFDDDAVCEITDDGVSSLGVAKEGKPCSLALQDVWSSVIR